MADSKLTALTAITSFSGDELFYVVDDDDGTPVSRKITVEDLATALAGRSELQAVLNGLYAALPTAVWVDAGTLASVDGSPALSQISNNVAAWLFDATSAERVAAALDVTGLGWTTFNVDIWWTNAAGGSGGVTWRHDRVSAGDGESITSVTGGTETSPTAPTLGTIKVTRLESGLAVPTGGDLHFFRIVRNAAAGGDTLANDAALLGVRFTKAS